MTSQSSKSSSKSNRSGFNIDEGNTGSGSSNKQRFSSVYQYSLLMNQKIVGIVIIVSK